jgi:hypothetical protein
MLLHKNQNTSSKTIEFHEVYRCAPKPPLVPKFNLGTRYAQPNDINHLHHQSPTKIRTLHKIRTKKSVQNRKKSHQKRPKLQKIVQNDIKNIRYFLLLIVNKLNPCLFWTAVASEARHRFGCLNAHDQANRIAEREKKPRHSAPP